MNKDVQEIEVTEAMVDTRVDRWLMKQYDLMTFVLVQKLIRTGQIRLDGKKIKHNSKFIEAGQLLRIPPVRNEVPKPKVPTPIAQLAEVDRSFFSKMILHEDSEMVVINKPTGLAVQGGSRQKRHIDGLMRGYFGNQADPKLVHRLDRATSGVLLLAKNLNSAKKLSEAFHDDKCSKTYWAIVHGEPPAKFDIEQPLIKAGSSGKERMYVDPKGKYARTTGKRIFQQGDYALVELKPITGRTHQLRVHMAHLGTPIFGDNKYGAPKAPFMALHAKNIRVPDPATGQNVEFSAPLHVAFEKQLKAIGFEGE